MGEVLGLGLSKSFMMETDMALECMSKLYMTTLCVLSCLSVYIDVHVSVCRAMNLDHWPTSTLISLDQSR